jgi:PKD repeat protein
VTTALNAPILPQAFVTGSTGLYDRTFPDLTVTGTTFTVNAGNDLQGALTAAAAANPNLIHEVVLAYNASWTGNFLVPAKAGPGAGWVIVRSSRLDLLPPRGTRITAADFPNMPKLISPNQSAALTWNDAPNSRGWVFIGIDSYGTAGGANAEWGPMQMWWFGWNPNDPNGVRTNATDLGNRAGRCIIERCAIRPGFDRQYLQRALTINCNDVRLCESFIQAQGPGQDCQGVFQYIGGGGPKLVYNNTIMGTGQSFMFGGSGLGVLAVVAQEQPQDVILTRNTLTKLARWNSADPAWDGINWTIKPVIEIKEIGVSRCLIEGNLLTNAYGWGPIHYSTTFCRDVTFQHNICSSCGSGGTLWDTSDLGYDGYAALGGIKRVKHWNNLIVANRWVAANVGPDTGMMVRLMAVPSTNGPAGGTEDIWYEHNTVLSNLKGWNIEGRACLRTRFANNVLGYGDAGFTNANEYGWHDDQYFVGTFFEGTFNWTGREWLHNAFLNIGNAARGYGNAGDPWAPAAAWDSYHPYTQAEWNPPKNATGEFYIVGPAAAAGFDTATGTLLAGSPLKAGGAYQADDGSDNGVNFIALNAAQAGIVADFTWQQTAGTYTMVFAGSLTGAVATAYSWKFGDPALGTSTQQNPSYTYAAAGNYTVEFHASDGATDYIARHTVPVVAPGVPPTLTITAPTAAATFATTASSLALGGTASDDVAVSSVTWSNDRGGTGTATTTNGFATWSVPSITLQSGTNVLTVTATDPQGNQSTDTLTVTYTAPAGPTLRRTRLGATSRTTV